MDKPEEKDVFNPSTEGMTRADQYRAALQQLESARVGRIRLKKGQIGSTSRNGIIAVGPPDLEAVARSIEQREEWAVRVLDNLAREAALSGTVKMLAEAGLLSLQATEEGVKISLSGPLLRAMKHHAGPQPWKRTRKGASS